LLLNVKPEGPENDADCCGARAGSPILARPSSAPGAKESQPACPLTGRDKCGDDRSVQDNQSHHGGHHARPITIGLLSALPECDPERSIRLRGLFGAGV
jgi:hypothetical protein